MKISDIVERPEYLLNFKTKSLEGNQLSSYARQFFEAYNIESPILKFVANIKRFEHSRLAESAEAQSIKPFIDTVQRADAVKKIKVGDQFAVLAFEINFAWKEIQAFGFLEPKQVSEIKLHQDGTINFIKFTDGDRYPRLTPAEYNNKPIIQTAYFNDRNSAESALTMLLMLVPADWNIELDKNLEPGLSEAWKPKNKAKHKACVAKVKNRVGVWPSAYASGQVVQCYYGKRKKS
jgi:hypothetical protein